MTTIVTDLRNTRDSAKEIRFSPVLPITATNVQDAIFQASTQPPAVNPTPVNFAQSPYAPSALDTVLSVDTSGGTVVINLAAAATRNGLALTIKDDTGNAAANPISIVPNGAEKVDNLAPYLLDSNYAAVRLVPQAGGYYVDA